MRELLQQAPKQTRAELLQCRKRMDELERQQQQHEQRQQQHRRQQRQQRRDDNLEEDEVRREENMVSWRIVFNSKFSNSLTFCMEICRKWAFWRHVTSNDVRTSDFQKILRNNILDHNVFAEKIWGQTDAREGNDRWSKCGPKNGLWRHSDVMMTSVWIFLSFPESLYHVWCSYRFSAQNHHFCGF